MDYRDIDEKFDRIASVGMFEHVGPKNYRTYMEVAHRCLNPGGLFLLHTIGKNLRNSYPDPAGSTSTYSRMENFRLSARSGTQWMNCLSWKIYTTLGQITIKL